MIFPHTWNLCSCQDVSAGKSVSDPLIVVRGWSLPSVYLRLCVRKSLLPYPPPLLVECPVLFFSSGKAATQQASELMSQAVVLSNMGAGTKFASSARPFQLLTPKLAPQLVCLHASPAPGWVSSAILMWCPIFLSLLPPTDLNIGYTCATITFEVSLFSLSPFLSPLPLHFLSFIFFISLFFLWDILLIFSKHFCNLLSTLNGIYI